MNISNPLLVVFAALTMTACGGGSSTAPASPTENNPITNPINSDNLQTGRFVDSAVAGLQYATESQNGITDPDGVFNYIAGESITFSIGDISLPTISAENVITPLSVFSTDDITDIRVMNLARLLQTLDTNADPTDGITLSDAAAANAAGLEVNFSSSEFENQVVNLVANSGSVSTELVDGMEALNHLQETLFQEGIDERPPAPSDMEIELPPNTENTSTHPSVGTSAVFSNRAHDVSGTVTVIDDRTLQITDFNYDGDGVIVFFYTGNNGNYRDGAPGAGPIGPQLNGRSYVDETITLTIPPELTLDDFNELSVWCIPFAASFGEAQL